MVDNIIRLQCLSYYYYMYNMLKKGRRQWSLCEWLVGLWTYDTMLSQSFNLTYHTLHLHSMPLYHITTVPSSIFTVLCSIYFVYITQIHFHFMSKLTCIFLRFSLQIIVFWFEATATGNIYCPITVWLPYNLFVA